MLCLYLVRICEDHLCSSCAVAPKACFLPWSNTQKKSPFVMKFNCILHVLPTSSRTPVGYLKQLRGAKKTYRVYPLGCGICMHSQLSCYPLLSCSPTKTTLAQVQIFLPFGLSISIGFFMPQPSYTGCWLELLHMHLRSLHCETGPGQFLKPYPWMACRNITGHTTAHLHHVWAQRTAELF